MFTINTHSLRWTLYDSHFISPEVRWTVKVILWRTVTINGIGVDQYGFVLLHRKKFLLQLKKGFNSSVVCNWFGTRSIKELVRPLIFSVHSIQTSRTPQILDSGEVLSDITTSPDLFSRAPEPLAMISFGIDSVPRFRRTSISDLKT